jgi:hypothetical protein
VPGVESSDPKKNGCPAVDSDGDGVNDDADACPKEKGEHSDDPQKNGCPKRDRDNDGISDDIDKCPNQPEDKDGFQDGDGCPDPDNDGDGISDKDDACPNVKGEASTDRAKNGCPNPDKDGDTYNNDVDQCPDAPEVFNGVKDEDGCPDAGGKPLVTVDAGPSMKLAAPLRIGGTADAPEVDKASTMTLRAIAFEVNRHTDWTLAIGARPAVASEPAQLAALARAFALVHALSQFTVRDGSAETVGWDAVKKQPQSETGIGLLVLVTQPRPSPGDRLDPADLDPDQAPPHRLR